MADIFDPYYEWLGIPPAEQPPNHYRLLGVKAFEDDPKLIHNAADQRIAYLRTFQIGKYSDESQKLLNKVVAARVCLSNSQKKVAYDEQLQEELKTKALASELQPPATLLAPSTPPLSLTPPLPPPSPVPGTKRSWQVATASGAAAILVCLALGLLLLRSGDKKEKEVLPVQVAARSKAKEPSSLSPAGEKATIAPKSNAGVEDNPAFSSKGPATPTTVATPRNIASSAAPPTPPWKDSFTPDHSAGPSGTKADAMPPVAAPTQKPTEGAPIAARPDTALHATASAEPLESAGVVNLLEKIDLARDTIHGEWKFDGKTLVNSSEPTCTVKIPYSPPDNYTLTAVVERKRGKRGLNLGLVVGATACTVRISCEHDRGQHTSGIDNIDQSRYTMNETTVQGDVFEIAGPHTIECAVRTLPQNEVAVALHVDGRKITEWQGASSRLSAGTERSLWLETRDKHCEFAIRQLKLGPLGAAAAQTSAGTAARDNGGVFVGQWDCGNVVITLTEDFTARKNKPNPLGKWECVNGEARIAWNDGVRNVLRRDGEGFRKLTWPPGVSLDSPPSNISPVAKKGGHEAEPTAIPSSRPKTTEQTCVPLFNGRNLKGWHLRNPRGPLCWSVKKGELICVARKKEMDLVSDKVFQDFELHLEFMLGSEANSGVYLRGRYEVQLWDTAKHAAPKTACGAVFRLIAPATQAYVGPDRWNTLDVTLVGRQVTVVMNDAKIIDSQYIAHPTGGSLDDVEDQPGPIMLQCWENEFRFRNIRIRPLK